ncbi:sigma-70 family RNA polymerase sigma factor [Parapedobacter tibetensis]|uniref:sigma-70 family RNA polymerase sigma factor n=1 Tax=Parapedobacter tibetensis TaxID=2972951 RepID=UPI00214D4A9E|nr:sigma-70 family RNA polymerase sigma factor [Parapedobacter tibetensis]
MTLRKLANEEEVLEKIAGGDERAFTEMFHAYYNQLGEFVQLIIHDLDATAEIVQEVFEKIWINRESLPSVRSFDAYLFILCRNHTLSHIRKQVAERKKYETYVRETDWIEDRVEEDTPQNPHELVERALQNLPPQQQRVFIFRQQGLKNPEISQRMNLSIESVKKYQHLAIKSIKEFVRWATLIFFIL